MKVRKNAVFCATLTKTGTKVREYFYLNRVTFLKNLLHFNVL